jgi:hypothetical protein
MRNTPIDQANTAAAEKMSEQDYMRHCNELTEELQRWIAQQANERAQGHQDHSAALQLTALLSAYARLAGSGGSGALQHCGMLSSLSIRLAREAARLRACAPAAAGAGPATGTVH